MHIANQELILRVCKERLQISKKIQSSNMIPESKVTIAGVQNCKCLFLTKLFHTLAPLYSNTMKLNLLEADKCPHQSEVDRGLR